MRLVVLLGPARGVGANSKQVVGVSKAGVVSKGDGLLEAPNSLEKSANYSPPPRTPSPPLTALEEFGPPCWESGLPFPKVGNCTRLPSPIALLP